MASKTAHAPRWRQLRAKGWPIISTWIDEAGKGETACFTDLWRRCVEEASNADCLIICREPDEVLKGAFIEAGAALAAGIPVYAVGCEGLSFVHHACVVQCCDLTDALREAHAFIGAEMPFDLTPLPAKAPEETSERGTGEGV